MKKIIILLLLPLAITAQKNYPLLLDNYAQAEFKIKEFNGAMLVMQKGKSVYKKAFGMADREWNIANTVNTKFRIALLPNNLPQPVYCNWPSKVTLVLRTS